MNEAKVRLSKKEMELLTNTDWILTKNDLIRKVKLLLENLQLQQQEWLRSTGWRGPVEVLKPIPKISKGENYRGLPYLILDHPRYFDKENIFAIRTLFWWGNFFSVTLHLSGRYKKAYAEPLLSVYPQLKKSDLYYCIHEEEWEHHFDESNYALLKDSNKKDFERTIRERPFIKLAGKIPLSKWDEADDLLFNFFKEMLHLTEIT